MLGGEGVGAYVICFDDETSIGSDSTPPTVGGFTLDTSLPAGATKAVLAFRVGLF